MQLWVGVRVRVTFNAPVGLDAHVQPLLVTEDQRQAQDAVDAAYESARGPRDPDRRGLFALLEERVDGRLVRDAFFVAPAPPLSVPGPLGEEVGVVFRVDRVGTDRGPRLAVIAVVPSLGDYVIPGEERGYMVLPCRYAPPQREDAGLA